MPSDKSEKKWELIDQAKQVLDLLYSEADAKADTAIQQFRGKVLQQLDQLRNTNYEDEIKILTDFNNQLISISMEAGNQVIVLKENAGNVTINNFNINSNNSAHENAKFNFDKNEINLNPTYHFHYNENKTEQPALSEQKESLALLYERFSSFYTKQRVKRTFGEPREGEDFDDLYTRLALIREREVKEDREHYRKDLISLQQMSADRIARDEHLHLFEHILYTERKPIKENQLFLPVSDDVPSLRQKGRIDRILLRGQAGVGKTTFCYHLARELIKQHHWVFVIPLRYLRSVTRELNDIEAIEKALPMKLTEPERALLAQLLVDKTQTVYWLLDGYDEVAALPEDHPVQQWLIEVFRKEHVVVTTRPRAVENFNVERQIEMIGYLPEDVEKYITRYFSKQPEKINTFTTFIKQQKQLGAIHRIPIILELMCWVWDVLMIKQDSSVISLSFTDLYVKVLYGLNRSYLLKDPALKSLANGGTDKEIEKELSQSYLDPLLELAYQTFKANRLIFTGEEVANYLLHLSIDDRSKLLDKFSLVRRLREVGSFNLNEFSFIHLTVQEFLMAKRWVQLFTSKDLNEIARAIQLFTGRKAKGEWIENHKYDKRFEVVWGFVAGLLKNQPKHLQRFLDLIAAAPRDQIGARHISLLLQVVGEGNCLNEDTCEYEEIATWLRDKDYRRIGLDDYVSILARYPAVISILQKEWNKLWAGEEGERARPFVIELLSRMRLDEKSEIYSDLLRALETIKKIGRSIAKSLTTILFTEAQQEQVIRLLFNRLQDANAHNARNIIFVLDYFYLRRPFSQGFPSNLFDSLFTCIEARDGVNLDVAAHVLRKMDLSEEKRLSILDTLLTRWRQAQFGSSNDIKRYVTAALGCIPIPEKRQLEITRFLLDRVNDKSDFGSKHGALEALSRINPPKDLQWEVTDIFLNYLGDSNLRYAATEGLRSIFILLSEQDQEQVMETLLIHINGNHREKRHSSFSLLQDIKIPTNYQALVLGALWNGLHHSDDEVKQYAAAVLAGIDIPEAMQSQFIDALLMLLASSKSIFLTKMVAKALDTIPISEQLKPKVREVLFNRFSQNDDYLIEDYIVRSLGRIGIPQGLGKKIIGVPYVREDCVLNELNLYCLILDDELPRHLHEVLHTFVFCSVDAKEVHLAGTFNNWLKASNGKIDPIRQYKWAMERQWATERNGGVWALTIRSLPGSYEFKYVIDRGRRWECDPNYPLSVNGNSALKIEPAICRTNETNGSHAQILSRLKSNSNNASIMTASSFPSKQAVDNKIALSDAAEPETDSTNASEEEDATTDMTHTMGWQKSS